MKQAYQVTCPFCAVGCRYKIMKGTDEVIFSSNTYENPINEGALCPRGHLSFELLSHPKRLSQAFSKTNGKLNVQTPEIIFQKIVEELSTKKFTYPLAFLFNPLMSIHDIRSLLEFGIKNNIEAIDFVSPTDRHLFRAMIDLPFSTSILEDPRLLGKLNVSLCIGDVFTKQPVLSRHLLRAKYAFRNNVFLTMNPIPTRTSWFADIHIQHHPHHEPLLLFYLLKLLLNEKKKKLSPELQEIKNIINLNLDPIFEKFLSSKIRDQINQIAQKISTAKSSAIFLSTHLYNAAGNYLSAIACAAINNLTGSYFFPLYTNSNLSALENLATRAFTRLQIGKRPILYEIMQNKFQFIFAANINPATILPGQINWPEKTQWLISSWVQTDFPKNTRAILPQSYLYEQLDLRSNLIPLQLLGSEAVKTPIGSSQTFANFVYLFHQNMTEKKLSINEAPLPTSSSDWLENLKAELAYYLEKLSQFGSKNGFLMIPAEHVSHHEDAFLSRFSSWAVKTCQDEEIQIPVEAAKSYRLHQGQFFSIKLKTKKALFRVKTSKSIPPNVVVPYAHYSPARSLMEGEFATHNKQYYFWCPRVQLKTK